MSNEYSPTKDEHTGQQDAEQAAGNNVSNGDQECPPELTANQINWYGVNGRWNDAHTEFTMEIGLHGQEETACLGQTTQHFEADQIADGPAIIGHCNDGRAIWEVIIKE